MESRATRIVFAGGGTGGHVFPALAVAEEMKRRRPAVSITFIGARGGIEQRLVPQAGYRLRSLRLSGLKGANVGARVVAVAAAGWAVVRCVGWMLGERPQLAVGVGGYASGPAMLAALLVRVPTVVLEQNHLPGATNRWLAPRVDAVCLPSEAARAHVGGRGIVTGNPVRTEVAAASPPPGRVPLCVLVFGGSRGARSLNRAVADGLDELARAQPPIRLVVQTGRSDEALVREACARRPALACEVSAFFDDMPQRLAAADLVVCRAGATTVAELCAAGRPAVLVPYPHAADDHQTRNAEVLRDAGAALVLADRDLTGSTLAAAVLPLIADEGRRHAMGTAARSLGIPDASRRIADVLDSILDRERAVA